MLENISDQSKEQKLQQLAEFLVHLSEHLKSAENFKTQHPDREDLNALIELNQAVQEEAKAVSELVEIEDDCPEDWDDLEEARGSLSRTRARIDHSNWVAQGPSNSRRFNQLFFHVRGDGDSAAGAGVISELLEVNKGLLVQDLTQALRSRLEKLAKILGGSTGGKFPEVLLAQLHQLEEFLDLSLFDQNVDKPDECAVCTAELTPAAKRCPSCGAKVLSLEHTRVVERQQERGRSRLLDALWDSWNQFQCDEIDQEKLVQVFGDLSTPILQAVQKIDSPSPLLLDFSDKLKSFTQLPDRKSLERNWSSLIDSGRALINERIGLLKKD